MVIVPQKPESGCRGQKKHDAPHSGGKSSRVMIIPGCDLRHSTSPLWTSSPSLDSKLRLNQRVQMDSAEILHTGAMAGPSGGTLDLSAASTTAAPLLSLV